MVKYDSLPKILRLSYMIKTSFKMAPRLPRYRDPTNFNAEEVISQA